MNIPSFNELREIANSRYGLVMLVSKRARKIVDGNEALIQTKIEKPVSIAIEEIIDGAVKFGEPMSDKEYSEKIKLEKQEKYQQILDKKQEKLEETLELETEGNLIETEQ